MQVPKKTQFSVKDEFTLLLLFLDRKENGKDLISIFKKQKNLVKKLYDRYSKRLANIESPDLFYQRFVVKKMLYHINAELLWLNELIEEKSRKI
jgi:hypothetical protein